MTRAIALISLCVVGFSTSIVLAEEPTDFARNGIYVGAGGIYAIENFSQTNSISFDDSFGFNFRVGYRVHPYIAIEAEGEGTIGFDTKGFNGDLETWTGTLNGKFFALTGQIQPYGLVGIGAMNVSTDGLLILVDSNGRPSTSETDLALRYGAGVDYYLNNNWVINLEGSYVDPRGDINFVNYFSVGGGVQYRF